MPVTVTVTVTATVLTTCALLTCGAAPSPSPSADKKLRHVIITSFGELPYEPMEGFYQGDVLPAGDDFHQQTMDVALRTGILVEDPNEKKEQGSEKEDGKEAATSTNTKRQVSSGSNDRQSKTETVDESDFLSLGPSGRYRRPKGQQLPDESSDQFLSTPRKFGYQFQQTAPKQKRPYYPNVDANGYNINTEYYGDLGEGWNLQDAEGVLRGRTYNILAPREMPPPVYAPPVYYPFPNFNYRPFTQLYRQQGPPGYSDTAADDYYEDEGSRRHIKVVSSTNTVGLPVVPYTHGGFYDTPFLSGV